MTFDLPDILYRLEDARLAAAFLAGAVSSGLLTAWQARRRGGRALDAALHGALAEAEARRQTQVLSLEERIADRDRLVGRAETRIEQLESRMSELNEELAARRASEAVLNTRLEETRRSFAEKEALQKHSGETLKRDFELLANRIFEHQGEQHRARLGTVLSPFKDQLDELRKRVEAVHTEDTRDRATLLNEVRNLQQASERINREAGSLTRALKGDVRIQGSWGEMVLERVLEASGLRSGVEYFVQTSRRQGDGRLKRPDVLIRLPDDKDVVVDAKLSLLAYEEALGHEDAAARADAVARHVSSLRGHVRRLAEQNYDRLEEVRSLDFVLLFVPIEAAFRLAMEHDHRLFTDAFERRIVIVSPTTLMMTLRIIHNVWRYEKQDRNAREIAHRAGALYDKLRGFVTDLETLGRQLETAQGTYQSAFAKLSTGKGNLVRRAEELRELGAPVKRPFPQHLVDGEGGDDGPAGEPHKVITEPAPISQNGARQEGKLSAEKDCEEQ